MPALANIVLADAQATPVNHTFIPVGYERETGKWVFEDQSASHPLGYWRLKIKLTKPKAPAAGTVSGDQRVQKVMLELWEPALETVGTSDSGYTALPRVAHIPFFRGEFMLSERSSLQNKKDVRKMAAGLINDALVTSIVELGQDLY